MKKTYKRGQRKAQKLTLPLGSTFTMLYNGPIPAGWKVVRKFDSGCVIRRVVDMTTGEVADDTV